MPSSTSSRRRSPPRTSARLPIRYGTDSTSTMEPERSLVRIARLPIALRTPPRGSPPPRRSRARRRPRPASSPERVRRNAARARGPGAGSRPPARRPGSTTIGGQESASGSSASSRSNSSPFTLASSVIASIIGLGLGEILEPRGVGDASDLGIGVFASDPFPPHRALQRRREHLRERSSGASAAEQEDAFARCRRGLNDPRAHEPGTDYADQERSIGTPPFARLKHPLRSLPHPGGRCTSS